MGWASASSRWGLRDGFDLGLQGLARRVDLGLQVLGVYDSSGVIVIGF